MSEFIRVRPKSGVQHEYDAPVGMVDAHPDLYEVLDPTPVSDPRPPKYVLPQPAVEAAEPVEIPEPSVGDNPEGEQS